MTIWLRWTGDNECIVSLSPDTRQSSIEQRSLRLSNSEDTSVDMVGLPTSTNRNSLLTSEMFSFIWTWLTFKVVQIFVSRNPKVLLLETIDDQGFCLV